MSKKVMLDTGFLITLFDQNRKYHADAVKYYRYFMDHEVECLVSTVVVAEFSVKQDFATLPVKDFTILPFNFDDAQICASLVSHYYGNLKTDGVQRDAVKDDFKILAQAQQNQADFLITEDDSSMLIYCRKLRDDGKLKTRAIPVSNGFDVSWVNDDGQMEL